jgi:hypothetical protein
MASIFTPTTWPTVLGPYAIDVNDCIGDSVGIINANTNYLASYTAAVSSTASTQIINSASSVTTTLSTVPYARLNDGGQTGSAPLFGARAWVSFDATRNAGGGTDALNTNRYIISNGNVSTVLKNGDGNYTITFSTAMPDTNYCTLATGRGSSSAAIGMIAETSSIYTTTQVRVRFTDTGGTARNVDIGCVVIYR